MKLNSINLFLASSGAITLVPWVNNAPDFTGFTEPTKSVLIDSYNDYIANGGVIEIIPDPEPVEEPVILNWSQFYKALKKSVTYRHLIGLSVVAPNISGVMAAMGIAIQDGIRDALDPDILPAFQASVSGVLAALNAINQPLTTEQLAEVRLLLDNNGFNSIQLQ